MAKNVPFRIKMYEMFENNPNITNEEVAKAFISIGLKKHTVTKLTSESFVLSSITAQGALKMQLPESTGAPNSIYHIC